MERLQEFLCFLVFSVMFSLAGYGGIGSHHDDDGSTPPPDVSMTLSPETASLHTGQRLDLIATVSEVRDLAEFRRDGHSGCFQRYAGGFYRVHGGDLYRLRHFNARCRQNVFFDDHRHRSAARAGAHRSDSADGFHPDGRDGESFRHGQSRRRHLAEFARCRRVDHAQRRERRVTIDYPGAGVTHTRIDYVNALGQLAGIYTGGGNHYFVVC
jgi:ribosomal protein S27AE